VLDADPPFRPVRRRDGYLAREDMGLIGDLVPLEEYDTGSAGPPVAGVSTS
jgi:hypothetical protein